MRSGPRCASAPHGLELDDRQALGLEASELGGPQLVLDRDVHRLRERVCMKKCARIHMRPETTGVAALVVPSDFRTRLSPSQPLES